MEGVETVKQFAFNNLINLESITLPSSIKLVEDRGICFNQNLTSVYIQKGAENFQSNSIYGCSNLNIYLEYPSLPSSFKKDFTDSNVLFEHEWKEEEN